MNLLNVLNWIGVFALTIGALISAVNGGGFVSALFAILLVSLLTTSLIPFSTKLGLILRGIPRIEMVQRGARFVGLVGCWLLAGIGGWEYLPAAIVLTISLAINVAMKIKEKRGRRRTTTTTTSAMIADTTNFNTVNEKASSIILSQNERARSVILSQDERARSVILSTPQQDENDSPITVVKIETPVFKV